MKAAVIGAGPAGLMASEVMAKAGVTVTVYEAKPSPARKFLMAGKSGLNLTFDGDFDRLIAGYGAAGPELEPALRDFDNVSLRAWAESLGQDTFVGSTGRVFPKAMKASPLLRAWLARLDGLGVRLERRARCTGLEGACPQINGTAVEADVTVLACGGASWARLGSDGEWAAWLGKDIEPFAPSNAGVRVGWSDYMAPHFGTAVKSVEWRADGLKSRGEAVLTPEGFEGGGVYGLTPNIRTGAPLTIDLVPDMSRDELARRWAEKPAKMKLARWLKNALRLPPVKIALVQECARGAHDLPDALKALPIPHAGAAEMDGAISTAGGVPFGKLDPGFMLRDKPGVFCAGEMLDWEAPTGGWLLTGCFATGAWAGRHAAQWVSG